RVLLVRRKAINNLPGLATQTSNGSTAAIGAIAAIEDLLESSLPAVVSAAPASHAVDPAYLNYTSGSSGQPKGVLVPHRGVARLVKGADYVSLTENETLLHMSPLAFDASTFELWGALLTGGRVGLLPPGQPSLREIGEAIRQHRVTTLWLTAGLFHLIVDERLDDLKPLRQLLAGGDVLSPQHVLKARRALPGCRIINGYGPTENTTFTCCYTVADEWALAPSIPIGRPIANTPVNVLDASLQPVPVGVVAEVVAGGNSVPDEPGLKAALKARLPDYMIPAHVEFLSALPLTPNGKVDRRALPMPTLTAAADSREVMPPRNLLELGLIRLWRRLFQREDIGRQDNFFELGGHSLLASQLASEIYKLLGCKLPIAALFQSPTVESLTRRLTRENWAPPWSSLVPLQPLGSQPPLFSVHGVGGDVYGFLELAKLLPPGQPSYGIQAVGLDGKSARHVTVEDMAAHYVKEILSFQRDGPFYLAGYSMGGLIAFEMARQLH